MQKPLTIFTQRQRPQQRTVVWLPAGFPSGPVFLFSKLLKKLASTPVSLVDVFNLLPSGCKYQPQTDTRLIRSDTLKQMI